MRCVYHAAVILKNVNVRGGVVIREIEYRAKDLNGEWVYGSYASGTYSCGSKVHYIVADLTHIMSSCWGVDAVEIDISTLGQYTGLKDKNGVKIFEGGTIRSDHFTDYNGVQRYLYHIAKWSEKYCGWYALNFDSMDENDGSQQLWAYMRNAINPTVTSNIHEEPVK